MMAASMGRISLCGQGIFDRACRMTMVQMRRWHFCQPGLSRLTRHQRTMHRRLH